MDAATLRQVQAAEPDASTWLSANAGSGKTRVLTDRVARLLLNGVEPQNILCLTYTKAAASEMQNRLFRRLGEWSMKPDDALRAELAELGVSDLDDPNRLAEARRLFARAIETPGGLRIQTIHSYCAALLRRFPLEAGVTPNFTEMDDSSALRLREQVLEDIAAREPQALDGLARHLRGDDVEAVLSGILSNREGFAKPVSRADVWNWFGLAEDTDTETVLATVFLGDEAKDMPPIVQTMIGGDKITDRRVGEKLGRVDWTAPGESDLAILIGVLLTGAGAKVPYSAKTGSLPTKALQAALGPSLDRLNDLMLRVERGREALNSVYAAQKSLALHQFAEIFLRAYEAAKTRRGWLDFDDLILRTRTLLSDPSVAQWVLYRLDGGLDHILVDEAQDTSPEQWQVIELLAQELTAGQGARGDVGRTIFVVGDKKQSIYSFQGADPAKFDMMRSQFSAQLSGSDRPVRSMELEYSFRSSQAILRFVDQSVEIDPVQHRAFWPDLPGRVDIWPDVPAAPRRDDREWFDPVDLVTASNHNVVLARQVAAFMKATIGRDTIPLPNGKRRLVQASDFLVLVRRRSTLFEAIIRACKAEGLPVAGADRLKLGAELAVKDLTALLSFLATPEDDLSLACALKSPLFGWSERQLYDLAQGRQGVYLWQELRGRADAFPETVETLNDLRARADFLRPFELIERVLTRHGGRRRLLARLGAEAEDGIDALLAQALSYERFDVPSLTGFLTWMQTEDVEVKRQLDDAGDLIRVMTVHGSKGLESPIVLLPDTAIKRPSLRDQIVTLEGGEAAWRVSTDRQPDAMRNAVEVARQAQAEEDERLFYVAATRAETWLIFAAAGEVGEGDASWYSRAKQAVERLGATHLPTALGTGLRYGHSDWEVGSLTQGEARPQDPPDLPGWTASRAPPPPKTAATVAPSELGGPKALPGPGSRDEEDAKRLGSMVHRLLELGPTVLEGSFARTLLEAEFPGQDVEEALDTAARLLNAPHLSHVFAPDVLSEVSLSADVPGLGRVSGTIDKLLVRDDGVTAIDFKTNAVEPDAPEDVPEGLLRQMGAYLAMLEAIYPDRQIEVGLLWTGSARTMALPHEIVRRALQDAATS